MTFISNHKLVQPQLILKKKVEPAEVEENEELLKSQYGDKLSDDVFNTIYEQTVSETVKEIKWVQPYDNAPIQVETKALFEQFITKLNAAVENAQLTEVVSYDELNDLYANMTNIRNDLSELLLPELNEDNYSMSAITQFLDKHNIKDVNPEDIYDKIREIYNTGTPVAGAQLRAALLNDFANTLKEKAAEQFLQEYSITGYFAQELVGSIDKIREEASKGGGMIAAEIKLIGLTDLQKELYTAATNDTKNDTAINNVYDDLAAQKDTFKQTLSDIFDNDIYAQTTLDVFTDREIDTFIDSIITEVAGNLTDFENYDINKLVEEVNAKLKEHLQTDPLAPMNITDNLLNTADYLLSDEEKAMKADMQDIEFDKDPEKIDGSGFDYNVMTDAGKTIASMTTDWDYMDIDTALNSKNLWGNFSTNTSSAKIYSNLEQMKPQLKAYIKEQMEANGYEYDEANVDKYLNYYITEAVREGIQAKYHESMPETYPDTILSSDCTIQDLAELLVTKVKEELAEGESAFGTNWQSEDTDPLLLATSDYFLIGEERIQKALMNNKKSGL